MNQQNKFTQHAVEAAAQMKAKNVDEIIKKTSQWQQQQPRPGIGTQPSQLSAKKYHEILLANGMQPDDGDDSSSVSNLFVSMRSGNGGQTAQNSGRNPEKSRVGDASNDSDLRVLNTLSQGQVPHQKLHSLAESQLNYNQENLRILQQTDRERLQTQVEASTHGPPALTGLHQAASIQAVGSSRQAATVGAHLTSPIKTRHSHTSSTISNAHLANLQSIKGRKKKLEEEGRQRHTSPDKESKADATPDRKGAGDSHGEQALHYRSQTENRATSSREIQGSRPTSARREVEMIEQQSDDSLGTAEDQPFPSSRATTREIVEEQRNQRLNLEMHNNNNQMKIGHNNNQLQRQELDEKSHSSAERIRPASGDRMDQTERKATKAGGPPSFMAPTASSVQKKNVDKKVQNQERHRPRYMNLATDRNTYNPLSKTMSKVEEGKTRAQMTTPKGLVANNLQIFNLSAIRSQDGAQPIAEIQGSSRDYTTGGRSGDVPQRPYGRGPDKTKKGGGDLSQRESDASQSLNFFSAKEASFPKKEPTKIVRGGPTHSQERLGARANRVPSVGQSKDMLQLESPKALEHSQNFGTQNFVSHQSKSQKAYQQRKVGIAGLKPYQSEKSIATLQEPKKNPVNLVLQHLHIMRDLNRIKGAREDLDEMEGQQAGSETSEEADLDPPEGDPREYLLNKEEMKHQLFSISYLPFLKHHSRYNVDSKIFSEGQKASHGSNFKDEIAQAQLLLNQFWMLLNFQGKEHIRRYHFYKLMKILMLNISKITDQEMHFKIAQFFLRSYEGIGIFLRPWRRPEAEQAANCKSNRSRQVDIHAIEEETDTKTRKIFSQYQNNGKESDPNDLTAEELEGLNDVQIINKYNQKKNPECATIQKFFKAFKHDHAQRYAYIQHEEATAKTTKIVVSPRLNLEKQTHETLNMIPTDGRKYKEQTIKAVIDQHTFKPKILKANQQIAHKRYEKLQEQMEDEYRSVDKVRIFEQGHESNRGRKDLPNDLQKEIRHTIGQLSLTLDSKNRAKSNTNLAGSQASSKQKLSDHGKLDFNKKYKLLMYQKEKKEQERVQKKIAIERAAIEKEDCTFQPKVNKKFNQRRAFSPAPIGFWQRTMISTQNEYSKLEPRTNQLTQFAWNEHEKRRLQEEAELTFKPKINKQTNAIRSLSQMSLSNYKAEYNYFGEEIKGHPTLKARETPNNKALLSIKGFDKAVKRMKDLQNEKEVQKKKIDELSRGENYAKLRASNIQPPSFIVSPRTKKKKIDEHRALDPAQTKGAVIFNAHISITPTRTESLIMREGECPEAVARAFADRYQLGEAAMQTLTKQLEYNIKLKREKRIESRLETISNPAWNKARAAGRDGQEERAKPRQLSKERSPKEQVSKSTRHNFNFRQKEAKKIEPKNSERLEKSPASSGVWHPSRPIVSPASAAVAKGRQSQVIGDKERPLSTLKANKSLKSRPPMDKESTITKSISNFAGSSVPNSIPATRSPAPVSKDRRANPRKTPTDNKTAKVNELRIQNRKEDRLKNQLIRDTVLSPKMANIKKESSFEPSSNKRNHKFKYFEMQSNVESQPTKNPNSLKQEQIVQNKTQQQAQVNSSKLETIISASKQQSSLPRGNQDKEYQKIFDQQSAPQNQNTDMQSILQTQKTDAEELEIKFEQEPKIERFSDVQIEQSNMEVRVHTEHQELHQRKSQQDLFVVKSDNSDEEVEQPPSEHEDDQIDSALLNRSMKKSNMEEQSLNSSAVRPSLMKGDHSRGQLLDEPLRRDRKAPSTTRSQASQEQKSGNQSTQKVLRISSKVAQAKAKDYQLGQDVINMIEQKQSLHVSSMEQRIASVADADKEKKTMVVQHNAKLRARDGSQKAMKVSEAASTQVRWPEHVSQAIATQKAQKRTAKK